MRRHAKPQNARGAPLLRACGMGALVSRALFEAQKLFADAVRLWHSHPHNPFAAPQVAVSKPPAAAAAATATVAVAVAGARAAASPAPVRSGPRQRPRPRPGAELAVALDRDAAMLHATLDALR